MPETSGFDHRLHEAEARAADFSKEPSLRLSRLGSGLINDTFLVESSKERWILQRLNPEVFKDPTPVMRNFRRLQNHFDRHRSRREAPFQWPVLRTTRQGDDFLRDASGVLWRAMSHLNGGRLPRGLPDRAAAREVGCVLGWFHRDLAELDPLSLEDPLPGFHDTPAILAAFDAAHGARGQNPMQSEVWWGTLERLRGRLGALEDARRLGRIRLGIMHGDPKIDNVLFDEVSGRALGLIDLDTVRPGLWHQDLGDCFRSLCQLSGRDDGAVVCDVALYEGLFEGYWAEARGLMAATDLDVLFEATWILPFELGLRFATDHLQGDRYFKIGYPGHNLIRARKQFALVERILEQGPILRQTLQRTFERA